jgi:DNA-binding protein HU-beta
MPGVSVTKDTLGRDIAPIVGGVKAGREVVDLLFDTIEEAVARGERVVIHGFGVFERLERPARTRRDPRDGSTVQVPAEGYPRFRPSPLWRDEVGRTPGPSLPPVARRRRSSGGGGSR